MIGRQIPLSLLNTGTGRRIAEQTLIQIEEGMYT
jgi:uncharacterized protein (DUF2384 family)